MKVTGFSVVTVPVTAPVPGIVDWAALAGLPASQQNANANSVTQENFRRSHMVVPPERMLSFARTAAPAGEVTGILVPHHHPPVGSGLGPPGFARAPEHLAHIRAPLVVREAFERLARRI